MCLCIIGLDRFRSCGGEARLCRSALSMLYCVHQILFTFEIVNFCVLFVFIYKVVKTCAIIARFLRYVIRDEALPEKCINKILM